MTQLQRLPSWQSYCLGDNIDVPGPVWPIDSIIQCMYIIIEIGQYKSVRLSGYEKIEELSFKDCLHESNGWSAALLILTKTMSTLISRNS